MDSARRGRYGSRPRAGRWAARLSNVLGCLFLFTPIGALAIPFGLWAVVASRHVTASAWRRGKIGLALGCASVLIVLTSFPFSFCTPVVFPEDRALQSFFDALGAGQFDRVRNDPLIAFREGSWKRGADVKAIAGPFGGSKVLAAIARIRIVPSAGNAYLVRRRSGELAIVLLCGPGPQPGGDGQMRSMWTVFLPQSSASRPVGRSRGE